MEASSFPQGNPLPNAALATSHVDQLSPTPPHPVIESTPPSDSALPLSTPPALSPPTPVAAVLPPAIVNPTQVVPEPESASRQSQMSNSNDLTPLARSVEDLSPALSAASTITTVPTDEEVDPTGDGRQSGPSSENGVQLGHGSDDGGPAEGVSPTKLVLGRRRSATGIDMPVVEDSVETNKISNGHAREESTLDSPIDPPNTHVPTPRTIATTSALPMTNGEVLPPLLFAVPVTSADASPIPTTSQGSPKQKFSAAPPKARLPDTPSSPPRPSTSRESATPIDPTVSPRRRPSTSNDITRERSTKDSEGRKTEREKEKEKERESTRSRKVLGEWTMSKTLGAGSMGKVKLGISSITGEKVRILSLCLFDSSNTHVDIQVAIKIIPRFTSTAAAYRPRQTSKEPASAPAESSRSSPRKETKEDREKAREKLPPSPSYLAKATAMDASKEVRTLREASLCLLLHHPYVCGMKSMFLYPVRLHLSLWNRILF